MIYIYIYPQERKNYLGYQGDDIGLISMGKSIYEISKDERHERRGESIGHGPQWCRWP